jgi:hypothetical protein
MIKFIERAILSRHRYVCSSGILSNWNFKSLSVSPTPVPSATTKVYASKLKSEFVYSHGGRRSRTIRLTSSIARRENCLLQPLFCVSLTTLSAIPRPQVGIPSTRDEPIKSDLYERVRSLDEQVSDVSGSGGFGREMIKIPMGAVAKDSRAI